MTNHDDVDAARPIPVMTLDEVAAEWLAQMALRGEPRRTESTDRAAT